jgi:formylglycine-generating enzyme required for sulfatase activity
MLPAITANAQSVSNVTAEQQSNALLIHYELSTSNPCEVSLFVSMNSGKSWTGPLLRVSGDVGKDISSGSHTIRWEVLEEMESLVGNNIQFKVVANGMKAYEPEMIFVEGGIFLMGSVTGEKDEQPEHQVVLNDFYICKYEVTQAQWTAVMGGNPSFNSGCDHCPVEQVSWDDVQYFISTLNRKTGKQYRLPTEAEWEYAARGGDKSQGFNYSGGNNIGSVACYEDNSNGKTHPVGLKQPNELGLYDMTGSVWEWCNDWYGTYPYYALTNPKGANFGERRVIRGGSWNIHPGRCRVSLRNDYYPYIRISLLGFRLVLDSVN